LTRRRPATCAEANWSGRSALAVAATLTIRLRRGRRLGRVGLARRLVGLGLGWSSWHGGGGLALAPGVEGVIDEAAAFEEPLVVGLGGEAALADGQQARAERVAVEVARNVGGVDDAASRARAGVGGQVEGVDEDFEVQQLPWWVNSASGASDDRARSRCATVRTWSAGT
jgi:hypothetical protein